MPAETPVGPGVLLDGLLPGKEKPLDRVEAAHLRVVHQHCHRGYAAQLTDQLRPAPDMRQESEGRHDIEVVIWKRKVQHVAADEIKTARRQEPVEAGPAGLTAP